MLTTLRIALLAGLLALVSNLAIISFIQWRTHDEGVAVLRQQVAEQAAVLADVYRSGGIAALQSAVDDTIDPADPQAAAAVLDARGRPRVGNLAALVGHKGSLTEGYHTALLQMDGETTPREAAIVLHRLPGGAWLLSGRTVAEGLSLRQTLERSLLICALLSILLGLACGLILAGYVGRRVRGIVTVADRISGGDLTQRVPLSGARDAFEGLARQFNHMLDRIGRLMAELRMLTDSLAHDLRSPVGRLRAAADAALAAEQPEERDQLLANVIRQADALMRILTTVLEISRSEALTGRNQFDWFDPGELASELAEMYEPLADEANIALTIERRNVILPLFGHRQLLAQAVSNLVENAIRYAAAGGEIRIVVTQEDTFSRLSVSDRGPGIPALQRTEARRRFGRLDSSRSAEGAGLGLALVEAITHLHNGKLVLDDNHPGLIVHLELPTANGNESPAPNSPDAGKS
ncbi:ATP-binding protein [Sphingomonas sp.]|uniref:HAMP domain-containing sensor histidine kinase n=1 Tax=Sphingomonas sp. TaxID=28214 RepID=UPI00286B7D41|nr:ATP-binding protein [Sphingomonas sp.]